MPIKIIFIAVLIFVSNIASADSCSIVYGKDWAFISDTSEHWSSACGESAMEGSAITLWQEKQSPNEADPIIYVTVSDKDFPTLEQFIADEQERFRKESPALKVSRIETTNHNESKRIFFRMSGATGNREEITAYIEGETSYFIVVMTSTSSASLEKSRSIFMKYANSFQPMNKK